MSTTEKLLEDSLLVVWNDRDADRRLVAMKDIYAEDIVFYENNEGPAFRGYQSINELIQKLQAGWPVEFTFELTASTKINHNVQLITWKLGIPGQEPVATGKDIAVIEADKIKSLHLLLDDNAGGEGK